MDKPLVVYTIVKRERDGRSAWIRIGTAVKNRDESIDVNLDALPMNGQIHIRQQRGFQADPGPLTDESGDLTERGERGGRE